MHAHVPHKTEQSLGTFIDRGKTERRFCQPETTVCRAELRTGEIAQRGKVLIVQT